MSLSIIVFMLLQAACSPDPSPTPGAVSKASRAELAQADGDGAFPFAAAAIGTPPAVTKMQASRYLSGLLLDGESLSNVVVRPLGESGITLIEGRAIAPDGAYARPIAVDHAGAAVDRESAMRHERYLAYHRHGRLAPELHARLLHEDGPFEVVLTHAMPAGLERQPDPSIDRQVDLQLRRDAVHDALAITRQPLLEWLSSHGAEEMLLPDYYPFVRLKLPRRALVARSLHESLGVARIDSLDAGGQLAGDTFTANASMGEPFCSDCYGFPTAAVVIETAGGPMYAGLPTDSPRLHNASYTWLMHPAQTCTTDIDCSPTSSNASCHLGYCMSSHATGVMGSIGMNGPYGAYAFTGNRNIYPAYASTDDWVAAFDWLTGLGWSFANISEVFGTESTPDHWRSGVVDVAARYHDVLTTRATGNCDPPGCQDSITVVPKSYNSLIVGNYSYQGTPTTPGDDRIHYRSVYGNPPGTDRELPEVAGPGSSDWTADPEFATAQPCPGITNKWIDGKDCRGQSVSGGTSFAAPAVLGAAMLMDDWYYTELLEPVHYKAILMTGARDANGDGPISINGFGDGKDGAGAPDVSALKRIWSNRSWRTYHIRPQDIGADGFFNQSVQVYVPAGYALRTGMAYNSCPAEIDPSTYTNRLVANFDLAVTQPVGPGNTILGTCKYCARRSLFSCLSWAPGGTMWSATFDNNYEMVFDSCLKTATQGGTFTIRVGLTGTFGDLCNGAADETVVVAWDVVPAP
jgi:hypothetical protein